MIQVYSNGASEVLLGKAIKTLNLPRDEIVVMTKVIKSAHTWAFTADRFALSLALRHRCEGSWNQLRRNWPKS